MKNCVLGYLLQENRILLAYKKKGFGVGKYNGFGGKLEQNETFEDALCREAYEEFCISPRNFEHVADLNFYDDDRLEFFVKAYFVKSWSGQPKETEEMRPVWFEIQRLPYDRMWSDDRYWLPRTLAGERLKGNFWFKRLFSKQPKLIRYELKTI